MTTSFDAPTTSGEGGMVPDPGAMADCGGGIDWSRGLSGLRRVQARSADTSSTLLTKVIEGEIIPRLFLAHRVTAPAPKSENIDDLARSDAFARLVLESESNEIIAHVERLLDRGIAPTRIFLDLLAPIARKLGEFWEEDRCTFTEVTLGLSRLHQVLHDVGRRGESVVRRSAKHRAYFAPVPGEQHTFGLSMLEEFFLHAGWETAMDSQASAATILDNVSKQRLDVVGISMSCQELFDPICDLIPKVRTASLNRDVTVMVGGKVFLDQPEWAGRLGRVAILPDAVHAVQAAENLLAAQRGETSIEGKISR